MAGGVESGELQLHLGQLVVGQPVATTQLHARVRPGEVQRDPVHAAVALRRDVIEQGHARREPRPVRVVLGDVGGAHLVDDVDHENADSGPELTPGANPRLRPAPEHDGDRALGKTLQDVALEEHPATLGPRFREATLALLVALAGRLHESPFLVNRRRAGGS